MIYNIKLKIRYDYAGMASGGRHLVRVIPRDFGGEQRVVASLLSLEPSPAQRYDRVDFFGNPVAAFNIKAPHRSISVHLHARVERAEPNLENDTTLLDDLPTILSQSRDLGPEAPLHFTAPSDRVPLDEAMTDFARSQLSTGLSVRDVVLVIGRALHDRMIFDARATTVTTPVAEAFARGRGVCQDFSHIMIACLRGIGIPAGYVSGYLRTSPPPGRRRLAGADAMHAWVRAWAGPQVGWITFDPTNACIAGANHIIVGYGRDYADVSPITGVLRGAGHQQHSQAVDVIPIEDVAAPD